MGFALLLNTTAKGCGVEGGAAAGPGVLSTLPPPPRDLLEVTAPGPATKSILDPVALGDLEALEGEVARGREGVLLPLGTRVG